ncbi:MAG: PQQ-binding-like beta-propeller repeat protein [Blastomonas sp.]
MRRYSWLFAISASLILSACGVLGGSDKPKQTPTIGKRTSILARAESGAEVDPNIADISVIYPPAATNLAWSQPGGNAAKAMGHVGLGAPLGRVWTAGIAGTSTRVRLAAAPVISEGKLFVMDTDGVVHAYDSRSGSPLWTTSLRVDGDGESSLFGGGASVDSGRVFATNGIGEVAALDADNGSVIWKVKPAGPLRGAPTLSIGNVYVMTQDNQLFALSQVDGSIVWNKAASIGQAGVFGVAAPSAGQGTVIAGYSSGELNAYRYENGRDLWGDALARTSISTSVATLSDIDADPIIDRGRVYAVGQGGRMAAYELVTGQRIWELNIAGISTPAIAGEWLFVLTDDSRILCISRSSGKVRWISQLKRWKDEKDKKGPVFWTGPVLAGGRLIVASTEGVVSSVATGDGAITPMFDLGSPVSLPPVVADNMLFLLDDGGRISAFR